MSQAQYCDIMANSSKNGLLVKLTQNSDKYLIQKTEMMVNQLKSKM